MNPALVPITHISRDPGLKGVDDRRSQPTPPSAACLIARRKVPIDPPVTKLNNHLVTPRARAEIALARIIKSDEAPCHRSMNRSIGLAS